MVSTVKDAVEYQMLCSGCGYWYIVIIYGTQEYEVCPVCGRVGEFHEFALVKLAEGTADGE